MSDKNVDEGRGRIKEAAGALTGNDSLKREGKVDQAKSTVKDAFDKAHDSVDRVADKVAEKVGHKD